MRLFSQIFIILFFHSTTYSQIYVDEIFTDWGDKHLVATDPADDAVNGKVDFQNLWVHNDEDYIFISFDTGIEINLQEYFDIRLFIDIDNNINTGVIVNGIGVDLSYYFGSKEGWFYSDGNEILIFHSDIDLIALPTVSGTRFELMIRRAASILSESYSMESQIRLYIEDISSNGDKIPSQNAGLVYSIDPLASYVHPGFTYEKKDPNHLRILCYNSLFDGLFTPSQMDAQRRILKSAKPDIIAFQEIYDYSASDVADVVESLLPRGNGEPWYRAGISPDIILISKYPITGAWPIDGNGAFRVNLDSKEMLLIITHLPCCGNDFERQRESDNIISFIRQAKQGDVGFTLEEGTPVVIMGDMNFVGNRQQRETLITGNIINESIFGPDHIVDWEGQFLEDIRFYNTGIPSSATWFNDGSFFNPGRLDYMLFTPSVMSYENGYSIYTKGMTSIELSDLSLLSNDAENSSDHLALVGDFDLDLVSSESEPIDNAQVKVFPNPVNDLLFVEFGSYMPLPSEIKILSALGEVIRSHELLEGVVHESIDVSSLLPGIYFLSLKKERISVIKKFIKL